MFRLYPDLARQSIASAILIVPPLSSGDMRILMWGHPKSGKSGFSGKSGVGKSGVGNPVSVRLKGIQCQFGEIRRNPVQFVFSGKNEEIRCQFVFCGKSGVGEIGVSSS